MMSIVEGVGILVSIYILICFGLGLVIGLMFVYWCETGFSPDRNDRTNRKPPVISL